MSKLEVGELLNLAYENFIERDYSLSRDYILRALNQDPYNKQAKEFKNYLDKHKKSNGRYFDFYNDRIYKEINELVTDNDLENKTIVLDLILFELKSNGIRSYITEFDLDEITETIQTISNSKNKELFNEILKLLNEYRNEMELKVEYNLQETNNNKHASVLSYDKPKIKWWMIVLFPIGIFVLLGWLFTGFISKSAPNNNKKK